MSSKKPFEGRRALLSVADKSGIVEFANGLAELGFELVSSGGTAKTIAEAGIPVSRVSEATGSPEILNGRVKTLHPKIHGGILARRGDPAHMKELATQNIAPVDIVAVNFYPFERTVRSGAPVSDWIENIDIGGPSMLRAACKNFQDVAPIVDPEDYPRVLERLASGLELETRLQLMQKAFAVSARYEAAICRAMARLGASGDELEAHSTQDGFPETLQAEYQKVQSLRYGENPHQSAAFYKESATRSGIAAAKQLQGKELSYNNILDLDAAWRIVLEFGEETPAAAVIKHTNPCGAALGETIEQAYLRARATDPVSAFGSIVALNRTVDESTANEIAATFVEAVLAPSFEPAALARLGKKKNLRLLEMPVEAEQFTGSNTCRVVGGLLVQDWDKAQSEIPFRVVSELEPNEVQTEALRFAWKAVKHVKSNAIVLAKDRALLGVGAGQMSRVDSCRLAVEKAQGSIDGAVAASDAFFPFRDGVDALADAGVKAVIQPGGSKRDDEVVTAANERGLVMVFTGMRHFRH